MGRKHKQLHALVWSSTRVKDVRVSACCGKEPLGCFCSDQVHRVHRYDSPKHLSQTTASPGSLRRSVAQPAPPLH